MKSHSRPPSTTPTRSLGTRSDFAKFVQVLVVFALGTGCAHRHEDAERLAAATPTLIAGVVHCGRDGDVPLEKRVISRSSRWVSVARSAQGHLNSLNQRATRVSPGVSEGCSITNVNLGLGWRKKVLDVKRHAAAARQVGAGSILITAVSSEEKCTNEGASVGGSYVEFGTSNCYEHSVKAAAVLVDLDGKVLWRQYAFSKQASRSHTPPAADATVRRLFRNIPVTAVSG